MSVFQVAGPQSRQRATFCVVSSVLFFHLIFRAKKTHLGVVKNITQINQVSKSHAKILFENCFSTLSTSLKGYITSKISHSNASRHCYTGSLVCFLITPLDKTYMHFWTALRVILTCKIFYVVMF